jgi:hypothetical protein
MSKVGGITAGRPGNRVQAFCELHLPLLGVASMQSSSNDELAPTLKGRTVLYPL